MKLSRLLALPPLPLMQALLRPTQQLELPLFTAVPKPTQARAPKPPDTRQVWLHGQRVPYHLKRSSRRTIGFSVSLDGLSVTAPMRLPLATIEQALHEKADWIVRKLASMRARASQRDLLRIDWQHSGPLRLPVLGQSQVIPLPDPPLGLDSAAWGHWRKTQATRWFQQQARPLFTARLQYWAQPLQVQWRSLRLSQARTRWGSASKHGAIMLNWQLMHMPLAVIDYVIVHELSHLHHMDHSAAFWQQVAAVLPDYAVYREQLRCTELPQW